MSRKCDLCQRTALNSVSRSHSMHATKRKQNLNLQSKTVDGTKIKICTSCLRTLNKKGVAV